MRQQRVVQWCSTNYTLKAQQYRLDYCNALLARTSAAVHADETAAISAYYYTAVHLVTRARHGDLIAVRQPMGLPLASGTAASRYGAPRRNFWARKAAFDDDTSDVKRDSK